MKLVRDFTDEKVKACYVNMCEKSFEHELDAVSRILLENEDLEFITLSGPTCSGKTTAASKLAERFADAGRRLVTVSVDDFYIDRSKIAPEFKDDFDSINTIDIELLGKTVDLLDRNGEADVPVYDFKTLSRRGYRRISRYSGEVILFEGIQALYPEVRALFDNFETRRIYISVESCLEDEENGIFVRPERIRLLRRLVRDAKFRKIGIETTLDVWDGVRKNELSSILPYKELCDIKLDSLIGYELSAIRELLLDELSRVHNKRYDAIIGEIRSLMLSVEPVDPKLVPANSLLREFIGY